MPLTWPASVAAPRACLGGDHTHPPYLYTLGPYSRFVHEWVIASHLRIGCKHMKDITITISGMSCGHCLNAVNKALHAVADIEVKTVTMGRADLRVPDASDATNRVVAAIEQAGYRVERVAE